MQLLRHLLICALLLQGANAFAQFPNLNKIKKQATALTKGKLPLDKKSLSQEEIGKGLREALEKGIKKQVSKLTATDGFYKNKLVKIALPEELKTVDKRLRSIGMGKLADDGIKMMNRAAEDAVKTATPIFVKAVKEMSFKDAKKVLMGKEDAATAYLKNKTTQPLSKSFYPVVQASFKKVQADKIWNEVIKKYNGIPFVKKVNPDLNDYVTQKALKGVFTMIAIEEKGIRKDSGLRNTPLLKKVFALQDGE